MRAVRPSTKVKKIRFLRVTKSYTCTSSLVTWWRRLNILKVTCWIKVTLLLLSEPRTPNLSISSLQFHRQAAKGPSTRHLPVSSERLFLHPPVNLPSPRTSTLQSRHSSRGAKSVWKCPSYVLSSPYPAISLFQWVWAHLLAQLQRWSLTS